MEDQNKPEEELDNAQPIENDIEDAQELAQENNIEIDQDKLERYLQQLRLEQNFGKGLIFAAAAAIIGAAIWAMITIATKYQIGYMAVAVGFIVGHAMRIGGKGIDKQFGIAAAVMALIGCLLGNFFTIVGFSAEQFGVDFFEALSLFDLGTAIELMTETFSPMDILFYGIAVYEGYNFGFRNISEEEIIANSTK